MVSMADLSNANTTTTKEVTEVATRTIISVAIIAVITEETVAAIKEAIVVETATTIRAVITTEDSLKVVNNSLK